MMKRTQAQWAVMAMLAGMTAAAAAQEARNPYIVQLMDAPTASYSGGVAGLAATKPAPGSRLNVSAQNVQNYISYIESRQDKVLADVSSAPVLHRYTLAFNGFAAMLTDAEVRKLKNDPTVANIEADVPRELDTNYTPAMLGLNAPGGLWSQLGGQTAAGEDIVIGVIDSGVWPENPSFADKVDAQGRATHDASGTLAYGPPPAGWNGTCETGPAFTADHCNNKLIGARFIGTTFLQQIALSGQSLHPAEFLSPRDNGGHGTHTASTAGGNGNVTSIMDNGTVPVPGISGMAPRARLAVYKICFTRSNPATTVPDPRWPNYQNGCYGSDAIKAIEWAIHDGVNVLNYSISGSTTNIADTTDVAFKAAVDAGIFVASSAGNSGPGNTVAHLAPWMTTVGNATHDRLFTGDVVLGNGTTVAGASSNPGTASAPLIRAVDAGVSGLSAGDTSLLAQCFGTADANAAINQPGVGVISWTTKALLDPAKVAGKIVVCDRGNNVLVNKSANAKAAGAAGVVIANVPAFANTIINQAHTLSTVHVTTANGDVIKSYIANNPAGTASLGNLQAIQDTTVAAPAMSDSSSRGPNQGNLNLLKPDIAAPGSAILAAYTPDYTIAEHDAMIATGQVGRPNYALLSGTSMSSPHIAGIAALLMHKYPSWSPAAIRSAMMTSTKSVFNTLTGVQQGALPWGQGAGFVQPNGAANPGLVYDITTQDYNKFLCGVGAAGVAGPGTLQPAINCATTGSLTATDLNLPSYHVSSVLGTHVFNRKVTNVSGVPSTYTGTATIPGFNAEVIPSSLTLAPGETKAFQVKLTRTTATNNAWNFGQVVLNDGTHLVRSPLVARANLLTAPAALSSAAVTGNKVFPLGTGFDGAMGAIKGFKASTVSSRTTTGINQGSTAAVTAACNAATPGANTGAVTRTDVVVPAGTMVARFAIYSQDTSGYAAGQYDDLDLLLVNSAGTALALSGNSGSDEWVQLSTPAAGTYRVCVIAYQNAAGATSTAHKLHQWVVAPNDTVGNFTVALPSRAYAGRTASAGMSWSNLTPGQRYFGMASYTVGGNAAGASTTIAVEPGALPVAAASITVGKGAALSE